MKKALFLLVLCWSVFACEDGEKAPEIREVTTPVFEGAWPSLYASPEGELYLSWTAFLTDSTEAVKIARLQEGYEWSEGRTAVRSKDLFSNWADVPSLVTYPGKRYWFAVNWLAMSGEGTYDYDLMMRISADAGLSWAEPFKLHGDTVSAEHGFASMIPGRAENILVTWLDGRYTKTEDEQGENHAMTLRLASIDPLGNVSGRTELDGMVCDCCPTDMAMTFRGPVVVYRDRSEGEIRDIGIVRQVNGQWTEPALVHRDNWEIAACPVNGPAADAMGNNLAVAWYTAAEGDMRVNLALSRDGGQTFATPVRLDKGKPLGRVDVVWLDQERAAVSWMESREDGRADILLSTVGLDGEVLEDMSLATTGGGRSSGFPVLAKKPGELWLAWTQVDSSSTTVRTAYLLIDNREES
ncbi:MAG: hypothetical protein R3350_00350 [Saprospiraceae bacterium]|nr:hypothetical protein [Saprospiraceae bacterium]